MSDTGSIPLDDIPISTIANLDSKLLSDDQGGAMISPRTILSFLVAGTNITINQQTISVNPSGFPVELVFYVPGGPFAPNQNLIKAILARAITFPANFAGCFARCDAGPSASIILTISVGGTELGTVSFAEGATTGTFGICSSQSFAAGSELVVTMPSPSDADFSGLALAFACTRT